MATYTADNEGKVQIRVEQGETVLSFALTGADGESFAPGAKVEIADERLQSLIAQLGAPFGIGQKQQAMAVSIEAKDHFYQDRTRIDRLNPEQADQFLAELEVFARERGFRIAKGGVTLTEKPGADELPTVEVLFVQWPRDL